MIKTIYFKNKVNWNVTKWEPSINLSTENTKAHLTIGWIKNYALYSLDRLLTQLTSHLCLWTRWRESMLITVTEDFQALLVTPRHLAVWYSCLTLTVEYNIADLLVIWRISDIYRVLTNHFNWTQRATTQTTNFKFSDEIRIGLTLYTLIKILLV